ncbi:hypothetical protein H0H10_20360 [Streptomyces sp. TRM S81-3]|uniref:Cyclic nucleotide-binding domain-containing protein n=1 Tax=Streptomyces griseicoloratus TaxID=2752516 RepID=A0A926QS82_9ACTN|nr:hypothetical protein [Streptomyces griseicoloratus]MBD0421480.1 hypothetical protein [Streptomyces griseicoloratus]
MEEFRGRRPGSGDGEEVTFALQADPGENARFEQPPFRVRRYRRMPGRHPVMVQEAVGPEAERRMRRHVRLFGSLADFHGPHLPRQLAHVLAHDDTTRPHRLLLDCRGERLADLGSPDRLHGPRLRTVVRDLFEAVAGLHEPRLVHGRISPEHLWWDDTDGLQLAGLDGAVHATEPLPERPATQWDAPGFRPGLPAAAEQDVHSAALVAFWIATGETLPRGASREHLHALLGQGHEDWLQELLRSAFPLGSAGAAPARELVRLLADGDEPSGLFERPFAERLRRREAVAREEFRALRARQRTDGAGRPRAVVAPAVPGTRRPGWWRRIPLRPRSGRPTARGLVVECPMCLSELDWDTAERVVLDEARGMVPEAELTPPGDAARDAQLARTYVVCPGNDDVPRHELPYRYPTFGTEPVRIGLVGASTTGKSHLLAAMIDQARKSTVMARFGLRVEALDPQRYHRYLGDVVTPFIDGRQELPATADRPDLRYSTGLIVTDEHSRRSHSVIFFDVAGGRLERTGRESDFLNRLSALLCVVDPTRVEGLTGHRGTTGRDPAFEHVRQRLRQQLADPAVPFLPVPCALVVTKCDLLRFRGYREIDGWLHEKPDAEGDLSTVEQESEDVYAFLGARGGGDWLQLAGECRNSTLHLASATGCGPREQSDASAPRRFDETLFRQHRVLRPLLSLLAMQGVMTGPAADAVLGGGGHGA